MKKKGITYILSSPSGGGKTSLLKRITILLPDIKHSISYTTRSPRRGEKNGRDYHFVAPEYFQDIIKNEGFAEWAKIHGHFYGTPLDSLEETKNQGVDLILDIDVQGARQLKERFIKGGVFIFLLPPSLDVLRERLINRGTDSDQEIRNRVNNAKEEIQQLSWYDYLIINDNLDEAVDNLKSIIVAERCKREQVLSQIKELFL